MTSKFYLNKDKKGVTRIVCMVKYKRKPYLCSTGVRWSPSDWDTERQRPKPRTKGEDGTTAAVLSARLDTIAALVDAMLTEGTDKTPRQFRRLFHLAVNSPSGRPEPMEEVSSDVVLVRYDEFIGYGKDFRRWRENTVQNYLVVRRHLELYDAGLLVSDLNFDGLSKFHGHLVQQGLSDSAIHDYFKCLMSFLRWLDSNGLRPDPTYRQFSFKTRWNTGDMVYLTVDELAAISSLNIPPEGTEIQKGDFKYTVENRNDLVAVRDMFVFCCTTGLRFSDMQALEWDSVLGDVICLASVKTGKKTDIELNQVSSGILDKYGRKRKGRIFPECSNLYMNVLLKKLGGMAGISSPVNRVTFNNKGRQETTKPKWKMITTHTGRHTFIANALSMGIPSQVVMSWTGHSDENTMKPYVAFTDPSKRRSMTKLELFLDSFLKKP